MPWRGLQTIPMAFEEYLRKEGASFRHKVTNEDETLRSCATNDIMGRGLRPNTSSAYDT